jgi:hypothetical protein
VEESLVKINSTPSSDAMTATDEADINATIKTEMDKINSSLAKITQCLNVSDFTVKHARVLEISRK